MIGRNNELQIEQLKAKAISGDSTAAHNIAVEYRILGRPKLAFQWWKKAAVLNDGEAWLELGYCYHHGLGTRRDPEAAAEAYESAIRSETICMFSLEEALYHRAVLLLECDDTEWTRASASKLLRRASEDGDYEQASCLLSTIKSGERVQPCCCRRGLSRSLGGASQCPLHRYPAVAGRSDLCLIQTSLACDGEGDVRQFVANGFGGAELHSEVLVQHVFSKCCDREVNRRLPGFGGVRRIPSTSPQSPQ